MKQNADKWGEEQGYHFSVYSTPSESLTDRFCRLDTKKFGIIENVTDKEYYTNSFHYDVRKKPTPFEKLNLKKIIQNLLLAGSFTIVSTQICNRIQKRWKPFGITHMIVLDT